MHLRNVPTCPEILGEAALANEPDIKQVFITGFTETETADRKLYLIRKRIENKVRLSAIPTRNDFYVVSLSTKSIIYKGMLSSLQLRNYYPDLTNSYFTSGLALVHSRFSTNTFPTWGLAQPFRLLAHNVKSIPFVATADGWKPVKAYSPLLCWEISKKYARSYSRV